MTTNYDVHVFQTRDGQWCARVSPIGTAENAERVFTASGSLADVMAHATHFMEQDQKVMVFKQRASDVLTPLVVRYAEDVGKAFRAHVEKAADRLGIKMSDLILRAGQQPKPNNGLPLIDLSGPKDPTLVLASVMAEHANNGGFTIRIVYYDKDQAEQAAQSMSQAGGSEHVGGGGHREQA